MLRTFLLNLAVRTGLEPATSAVTGRHSNQLNYRTRLLTVDFGYVTVRLNRGAKVCPLTA